MQVVPDETLEVPGYERHTLQCSRCNDVERRLVFNRESAERASEPVPESTAPPVSPVAVEFERAHCGSKRLEARGCDVSRSPCQPALGDRERSKSSWPLRHIAAT